MYKLYLSASTQKNNVGVGNYGTEEDNMFKLRDLTIEYLNKGGYNFNIAKNSNKSSTLADIVNASNKFNPDLHLAFHTNASSSSSTRGCEVYYSYLNTNGKGYKIATLWYNEISKVTPSSDIGVFKDSRIYNTGFYELRKTNSVASLAEFIFHTNLADVKFFKANIHKFALCSAKAFYKYFGLTYKEAPPALYDDMPYVKWMYDNNLIYGKDYKKDDKFNIEQIGVILKRFHDKFCK